MAALPEASDAGLLAGADILPQLLGRLLGRAEGGDYLRHGAVCAQRVAYLRGKAIQQPPPGIAARG